MFLDILVVSIVALAILDGFVRETTEYDDFYKDEQKYAVIPLNDNLSVQGKDKQ